MGGTSSDVTGRGPGFRGLAFAASGSGQKGPCNASLNILTLETKIRFAVFMFVPSKKLLIMFMQDKTKAQEY